QGITTTRPPSCGTTNKSARPRSEAIDKPLSQTPIGAPSRPPDKPELGVNNSRRPPPYRCRRAENRSASRHWFHAREAVNYRGNLQGASGAMRSRPGEWYAPLIRLLRAAVYIGSHTAVALLLISAITLVSDWLSSHGDPKFFDWIPV